jgi:2-polyprenyl-3-methyl-5-hydroxy-6-metoxy-1,4-benzoquinol methylase
MSGVVHYTECPVCSSKEINPLLTVKDHTVSKESFVIWQCGNCSLRFTQDVPTAEFITPYYRSENYISHTNTDKGFINRLYKKVRNYTLQSKADLIIKSTCIAKGSLLDVGCGIGAFLNVMQQRGWQIKGLEPDENARKLAKELFHINAEESSQLFELPNNSFDAITMWHVLEHVHDLHAYMEQLKNLMTKTGKLFIAVPNYSSLDADIYRLNWAAYDVPRHLYHFTPKAIKTLVQKHGMKLVNKKPMWFDSFYISMLSSKYKNGKTGYIASFINGLRSNAKALFNPDRCSSIIYIIEKA